jgi:ribosomal protein S18 acetylase RimI-like enzyme
VVIVSVVVPSLGLIRDLARVDADYTLSRLQVMERLPGNPFEVASQRIDHVTALRCRVRSRSYNRVVGLGAGDEDLVEPLLRWYQEAGRPACFEVAPGQWTESLARHLHDLGCSQSGFHATLATRVEQVLGQPSIDRVERVEEPRGMADFLEVYFAGWDFPEEVRQRARLYMPGWLEQPGWSLYLARSGGAPAAVAVLYCQDGVGYLADATTLPSSRGRGLQSMLLRRRVADAAAAGVETVFGQAEYLSGSYRNMLRAGLGLLYNQGFWTSQPDAGT